MPFGVHIVSVSTVGAFYEHRRRFGRFVILDYSYLDCITVDFSNFCSLLVLFLGSLDLFPWNNFFLLQYGDLTLVWFLYLYEGGYITLEQFWLLCRASSLLAGVLDLVHGRLREFLGLHGLNFELLPFIGGEGRKSAGLSFLPHLFDLLQLLLLFVLVRDTGHVNLDGFIINQSG
jgi:hypothetical protein